LQDIDRQAAATWSIMVGFWGWCSPGCWSEPN